MWDFLFHSLWGTLSATALIVIVCGLVAYFFPPLRRTAIEIGAVVLAAASIYAKGNHDEAKKWNQAIEKDVAKGAEARSDAERDVAAGRVRGTEWDRDNRGL